MSTTLVKLDKDSNEPFDTRTGTSKTSSRALNDRSNVLSIFDLPHGFRIDDPGPATLNKSDRRAEQEFPDEELVHVPEI